MLDTDAGRAAFWAETAVEQDGVITFEFVSGLRHQSRILRRDRPAGWSIEYFGSKVNFDLVDDGAGGTDLTLVDEGVDDADRCEVMAGWLNVAAPVEGGG